MAYKNYEIETVIVQRLEAMEDFLKEFISSLEEPLQTKGLVEVRARIGGTILEWYVKDEQVDEWVKEGQEICLIGTTIVPGGATIKVRSPATGSLHILAGTGAKVRPGMTIATIKTSTLV